MKTLLVEPQLGGKGRSFFAALLASVTADALWPCGQTDANAIRPVWMMFGASEGEAGPFTANLRLGRRASIVGSGGWSRKKEPCVELLRSAGYSFATQRFAEGSVVTAYLPDLFRLDPGMVDPSGIRFIVLPARAWLEAQDLDASGALEHVRELGLVAQARDGSGRGEHPTEEEARAVIQIASLFAAYLDRRTRAPLIPDLRFHAQLLLACLALGLASRSAPENRGRFGEHRRLGYVEQDVAAVGLSPGVAMLASHSEVEDVLADQVALYLRRTR